MSKGDKEKPLKRSSQMDKETREGYVICIDEATKRSLATATVFIKKGDDLLLEHMFTGRAAKFVSSQEQTITRQEERIAKLEKQVSDLTQTEHKSFIEYRNSLPGMPAAKRQAVIERHYRAGRVSMRAEILDKLGSVARKSLGENNE